MTAHATAEILSAYLDRELPTPKVERLEDHLETCPRCRAHLDSLTRVVGHLQRLERTAPPPILADRVARRVNLERARAVTRGGMVERLESKLGRVPVQSSIFSTFALVLALAAILYFFALALDTVERKRIPLVVTTPEELAASGTEMPARVPGYTQRADGWWQDTIPRDTVVVEEIGPRSEMGRAILSDRPELNGLLVEGLTVVVRHDGRVVRLRPPGPDAPDRPDQVDR